MADDRDGGALRAVGCGGQRLERHLRAVHGDQVRADGVGGEGATVLVQGAAGAQDMVRVSARDVKLSGFTVAGCVPNPSPSGGMETNGSSGVRINDGATNVTVQGLTIRDSHAVNPSGLPFGCYGTFVHNADQSKLIGNDISGNGDGIFFKAAGATRRSPATTSTTTT